MTTRCARCGAAAADRKLYPPGEWVTYLVEERGLDPVEGVLSIPLCGDCNGRLVPLREAFRERASLDPDRRDTLAERVDEALEDLSLEALRDETESLR